MITIIRQTSAHGVVRTIAVERTLVRKTRDGRTERYAYGRWYTKFGGWTRVPEWHLLSSR